MFNVANKRNRLWLRAFVMLQIASMLFSTTVWALPQGANVAAGSSTITQPNASTMHINQTTDKSIINWQGYSIGASEKVQYSQPGSGSISLNRVIGVDPSHIYGQLSANGQVWVINPNGLLIGNGASINVGSFVGSTLNIGNEDFMAGNYKFINSVASLSSITNQGNIQTADGGYVVLISPSITNDGTITTNLGKTYLASGDEVTLNFAGNDLIGFTIDKAALESATGITNKGAISANGGEVILSAKVAGDLFKTVINNEGVIEAKTVENRNGVIKLLGGMENNAINVSGTLDASAPNGGDGGFIETSAASVKIADGAIITTFAPYGKTGTWLIDPTDYTIASSGGDITGSQLSANLGTSNIDIQTSAEGAGNGDIFVNDNVSWTSASALTLNAENNIYSNAEISGVNGSVTLNAPNGAITDGNGAANNITAKELVITAYNGVDLDTAVSNLNVYNDYAGDITIRNTGSLTIDDFAYISCDGYGIENWATGGKIAITNQGSVDMPGTYGSGLYADDGNITLTANGITSDITVSTEAAYSNAGSVSFTAGQDIILGLNGNSSSIYTNNGSGSIGLDAGRDVIMDNGSYLESNTGNINITAGRDMKVLDANGYGTSVITDDTGGITVNAGNSIYVDSDSSGIQTGYYYGTGGDISLTAGNGGITLGAQVTAPTADITLNTTGTVTQENGYIEAVGLELLGTGGNYTLTSAFWGNLVNRLAANTGTVNYSQDNSLTIGTVNTTSGITASNTVLVQTTAIYSDIALDNGVSANGTGDAVVLAAGQNFLNSAGSSPLEAPNGRYLVYSTDPAQNTFGGFASPGNLFNRTYDSNPPSGIDASFSSRMVYSITPTLTITANHISREYGDSNPALTSQASGLIDGDATSTALTGSLSTAATQSSNAGTYSIMQGTVADQLGYTISYTGANLSITPAPLSITADDKSKEYGDANPALTATYSGFKLSDDSSVVSGLTLSTAATTGSNVGSYTITAADGTATNYTITFNNGVLTITAAPATTSETVAHTDVYQEGLVNIINEISGNPTNIAERILTTSDFAGFFTTEAFYENTFVIEDMPRSMEE